MLRQVASIAVPELYPGTILVAISGNDDAKLWCCRHLQEAAQAVTSELKVLAASASMATPELHSPSVLEVVVSD